MKKTVRDPKATPAHTLLASRPWHCTHFGDTSEIEAHNPATGAWETIADVRSTATLDAEDIADFIVRTVNGCEA